ncbi:signal transducing adapter molecule 1-like [Dendronephthya gigantea]|uniref:signal transducing adapter molecule 1-like n=1 Tax=Dendronephthya gigantea TaxID=151771 RepID=UPI0010690318|nr:signal transducing adapter molecule 1-like [Dendronephthya gigantea]
MPFYTGSSPLDDIVEKATTETNTSEDWGKIMDICDRVSRSPSGPKDALKAILKRVVHRIPQVSLQALSLLDACVNNCGKSFHLEICSRDFVSEVRNILKKLHRTAALKMKGMIRDWAKLFKNDSQLNLIPTLYEELKREKEDFPEGDASSIGLSSVPAKKSTSNEDDDLALAIQLSLSEAKSSQPKTQSLYPSISSSQSSSSSKSRKVRALYDFEAVEDNELTFKTGDIITVTDNSDANWWKGDLNGKSGLFPANFVSADLTPKPKQVKKKNKKKSKKVSFSEKNSVKEFEASKAVVEPLVISEEKIEKCLEMLKNASVEDEEEDDDGLIELEETCKKMAPLIAEKIQSTQKRHDDLTDLNDSFLIAMDTYQKMSKEPIAVRQTYPVVGQVPQYTGYNAPMVNNPTIPQSFAGYPTAQYVPGATLQHPQGLVVADGMGAAYSSPGPPNYAAPLNQGQYVPQLQQNLGYQVPGKPPNVAPMPGPTEYYSGAPTHVAQYQPEYTAAYGW